MKKIKLWGKNKNLKIKRIFLGILSLAIKVYFKTFKFNDKYALYKWVLEIGKSKEGKLIKGAIVKFPEEFRHIIDAPENEKIDFQVKRGDNGYFITLPFGNYYINDNDIKVVTVDPSNPISDLEIERPISEPKPEEKI